MTKLEVLTIFARNGYFLRPDEVWTKLRPLPDRRSFYSYLGRLRQQGLLERDHGSSDFDVRHAFNAAFTYDIPTRDWKPLVDAILKDWSVDAIYMVKTAHERDLHE
jgi:hypothetical protein